MIVTIFFLLASGAQIGYSFPEGETFDTTKSDSLCHMAAKVLLESGIMDAAGVTADTPYLCTETRRT